MHFCAPPFGLLVPSNLVITLNRLLGGVTIASRSRLSTLQWRRLKCPGLMSHKIGPSPDVLLSAPVLRAGSLTRAYPPVQRLPGHRGFILCSVTGLHRPRVFSTTRESATLCTQPRFGFAFAVRFYEISDNSRSQHRRVSLGKTHYLPVYRPTLQWFGSPDIRSCSATPARPPCHCHIVGSLFATYTGSASCFLRTPHFWKLPLPCRRCPSVR